MSVLRLGVQVASGQDGREKQEDKPKGKKYFSQGNTSERACLAPVA
jgi:hypothetical protein